MKHKVCDHSVKKNTSSITSAPTDSKTYTCPMHLEIKKDGPGECPICGMALEPETFTEDTPISPELSNFKIRFFIGLLLSMPIIFLEMTGHLFDIGPFISKKFNLYLQFSFSIPVVFWCGAPFFIKAYRGLLHKSLNMFSLISIGTSVAFFYSTFVVFSPSTFPDSFKNLYGNIPVYFESASIIIILVLLGQIFELKAREKTGNAIKSLLGLAPKKATLISKNGDEDILIENIKVGDLLRIRPGEKVPTDGTVIEGSTYINESMITGESIPIHKSINDLVIGGTINENGSIIIKAQHVGSETVLSNIVKMVANAQRSKATIQKLADLISGWFVPIVIAISIISFISWLVFDPDQGVIYGFICSISVLIISCPCALGLATPMSIMVGVGKGSKIGVLIKDAQSLETLEKVNTIILDKTGTITEGKPTLELIYPINSLVTKDSLLQIAASLEQKSQHPLSLAITKAAKDSNIKLLEVKNFNTIPGKGITGEIKGQKIWLGNQMLIKKFKFSLSPVIKQVDKLRSNGSTVIFLSNEETLLGYLTINDPIKESTFLAIEKLKNMNLEIVMLTGDNEITARSVANKLNIQNYKADILPENKAKIVKEYQNKGKIVAMVGDGINDAPALSTSNIGVSMGSGTDIAIESSDITLIKGNLLKLVSAINLSQSVMINIKQNLFLAFIYNALGIPIAAGILYPFFSILLSPIFAAAAMSLSSISIICNSLRLNLKRLN